ncbi:MAG: thioredoxin domain-containing protein, partial [Methyloceanibacter sp.]
IFLSVGYSTCYWCHVAERTIYSNPAIAALMNRWFVNIKIDREERPDLDQAFMLARQLLTGSGGWPNNLFLTPDLKPFFAGSYFPPEDREGANGFPTILKLIHEDWEKSPAKIKEIGDQVQGALSRVHDTSGKPASVLKIRPADRLATARDQLLEQRDKVYVGLDGVRGTKIPQSPVINLLLTDYRLNGTAESLQAAAETLNAMAIGGIHDHLGGGMHRYSTEPTWSVPHFEKMLYDNAQLIGLYADYYAITRRPLARAMATDIANYLAQRMTAPDGGFYTAEDADIEGKEGETYVWTRAEIADILGSADADRLFGLYDLTPLPNEPGGQGVLRIRRDQAISEENRASLARRVAELA